MFELLFFIFVCRHEEFHSGRRLRIMATRVDQDTRYRLPLVVNGRDVKQEKQKRGEQRKVPEDAAARSVHSCAPKAMPYRGRLRICLH